MTLAELEEQAFCRLTDALSKSQRALFSRWYCLRLSLAKQRTS
jgi:hypothetical protein